MLLSGARRGRAHTRPCRGQARRHLPQAAPAAALPEAAAGGNGRGRAPRPLGHGWGRPRRLLRALVAAPSRLGVSPASTKFSKWERWGSS